MFPINLPYFEQVPRPQVEQTGGFLEWFQSLFQPTAPPENYDSRGLGGGMGAEQAFTQRVGEGADVSLPTNLNEIIFGKQASDRAAAAWSGTTQKWMQYAPPYEQRSELITDPQAQAAEDELTNILTFADQIERMESDPLITEQEQLALDYQKEQTAQQLAIMNKQIQDSLFNANLQNVYARSQMDPEYEWTRDELLTRADIAGVEPGLTKEFFEEFAKNKDNPDAMMALLSSESINQQLLQDVADFTFQKQQATSALKFYEADLMAAARQRQQAPALYESFQAGPEGAFFDGMLGGLQGVAEFNAMPLEMQGDFVDNIVMPMTIPTEDENILNLQKQAAINWAISHGVQDPESFYDQIRGAIEDGERMETEAENWATKTKFNYGDSSLLRGAYQVLVEAGIPEDQVQNFVFDGYLPLLIQKLSQGKVNFAVPDGSQAGIAALPRNMYKEWGDFDAGEVGIQEQILTLYAYIQSRAGGSPQRAYEELFLTGQWGQ